jgi:hypothetical protein
MLCYTAICRPPNGQLDEFFTHLCNTLDQFSDWGICVILIGDFGIDVKGNMCGCKQLLHININCKRASSSCRNCCVASVIDQVMYQSCDTRLLSDHYAQ